MTKRRSTKGALLMSVLSLFLCFSMLLGTTFAWFTDEVESGKNVIKSGNLDITLEYYNGTGWTDVKGASAILDEKALWEPGYTEVAYFRIKNNGSLALKYQFGVNIVSETEGVNKAGESFKLSDYIYFDVVEGVNGENGFADRDAAMANATETTKISAGYSKAGELKAGSDYVYLAMVIYMPTTVGNAANHNGTDVPQIELGVNVVATQVPAETEKDSFDEFYDAGAPWMGLVDTAWYFENPDATEFVIDSPEELAGLAAIVNGTAKAPVTTYAATASETVNDTFAGKTVKLGGNIDLNSLAWTPIGRIGNSSTDFTYSFKGTFDGQNYTVYNLDVMNDGWAGLFGIAYKANIKNLKLSGVTLNSNRMTGSIVGQLYGSLDNCHVENANIMVVPNKVGDKYDNGDKVGGLVGWIGDNGNNHTLTNCSATGVTLGAYRDVGGIAGYVASSTVVSGNAATKVEITVDQITNHYGEKATNAGAIIGRDNGAKVDANTTSEITIDETYYKNGLTLKEDESGEVVLYLVSSDYAEKTVNVPEGVTAIGNYAFAYNTNVEEVVLASTVRSLGRGFDSSTVKKVVLNEGLEVIDSRAFRRTYNLEEVVISSTVTTIADNAFQSSAIKTIVFPENVAYIGDSCFTAASVEKVIIEGSNVEIAHYAFRDCPNLTTVTILSDTVTLGDGMIFSNSQNNNQNPNNITIYVKNATVKAAIVANGTFNGKIVDNTTELPEDKELSDVLTDGADSVYVPADKYATFPSDKVSEGDVIVCAPGTVFTGTSSLNVNGATVVGATFKNENGIAVRDTISGTFKDCVFEGSEALRWCYSTAGDTVVFENCVIKTDFRGVHFDSMDGDVIFRNCEINGFNAIGGSGTITFENCTFGNDRSSYNGLNMYTNINLIDCTFNYVSGKTNFIDMEGIGKTLTIQNCVATLDGKEVSILDFVGGSKLAQNSVVVDGVDVY